MTFKDIIGPDELDWKVVQLDWKKIGKNELKLGTPMSKDGVEANDANCYGILMDDVEKGKHEQARVIVSGCVDFTKAEEYSGIKISAEAKKAIGKVWSQGGGGLTELPDGYPYKEGSKTEIVWDGNPEGKVNVEIDGEVIFTKVSDATPSVDELSPMYAKAAGAGDPIELDAAYNVTGNGCIYLPVGGAPAIVIAHEPNASISNGQISLVFPEAGVYFGPFGHYGVTGYFCYGSETIHTIAPEYLPEGYPYKEKGETVISPEQTVEFADQGGQLLGGLNEAFFVSGNTYKIIWDGTAYVCTATEIQGTIAIGNLSNVGGTGNNEPFMMMVSGGTTTIVALEGGTEHTVSISEYAETIHPMAEEFIQLTSPNGTKYKLAVSDNGTLSAVAVS